MSSLRLIAVPVCALLFATACGRTEAVFVATGHDTAGDTWSYEDTSSPPPPDMPGWDTVSDESTDDWMTGDWGEEAPDTWGESTDVDWGDSTDLDWGDTTDVDWGETDPTDTTATDTTDTTTDTTDTTDTTTTDTGGDTCADAALCLVDCGSFSGQCINDCTSMLPQDESSNLFDLQICAIQACFFQGACQLGDFNSAQCIQCRLDVNLDPQGSGCAAEGNACGI